jgi:hypothetical protein
MRPFIFKENRMKEKIQEKLTSHIEKILAKEEIGNDEYYILLGVLQRIEREEKAKVEFEKSEKTNKKYKEQMQALFEMLNEE